MKDPWKKYQYVWPKDHPNGNGQPGPNGWFGRMNDIIRGKGPDIFVAQKGKDSIIKADRWGNWDSYHDRRIHVRESASISPWTRSRNLERYDPKSRTYKDWFQPHDFNGLGVDGLGISGLSGYGYNYPHFTRSEGRKMARTLLRGGRIDPSEMDEWSVNGPLRFDRRYDHFWRHAHRTGENRRQGISRQSPNVNPFLSMEASATNPVNHWIWRQFY